MTPEILSQKVKIKLFMGCFISTELKQSLFKSFPKYSSEQALKIHSELTTVSYKGKLYVGLFFEKENPTFEEIKTAQTKLLSDLEKLFPEKPSYHLCIFPQIFFM